MSSFIEYTSTITNPNETILRRACESLAQLKNGRIVQQVKRYGGEMRDVDIAVVFEGCERGIGVRIENGELHFVYDDWAAKKEYEQARKKIVQLYEAHVLQQSMQNIGLDVSNHHAENGIALRAMG